MDSIQLEIKEHSSSSEIRENSKPLEIKSYLTEHKSKKKNTLS